MSKRKKSSGAPAAPRDREHAIADDGSVTTRAAVPPELLKQAKGEGSGEHAAPPESGRGESSSASESSEAMPESAGVPVDAEGFEDEGAGAAKAKTEASAEPAANAEAQAANAEAQAANAEANAEPEAHDESAEGFDSELTVNLVGELPLPGRDDLDEPTVTTASETLADVDGVVLQRKHLRGLLEALVFASDSPITPKELAKLASAPQKQVKELLAELKGDYATRGMHLDEVAGGWVFRTSPQYAPFVRDLTKQKPVRLTRAQVETLAIIAYRQPITRPEIDDVRGVDSGPVLKLLLERDLVRILGKRDEPGRPLIYGTTAHFLEFFGLKSLKDLPTLREFTELSDESREAFEDEIGETPEEAARRAAEAEVAEAGREGATDHAAHEGADHEAGDHEHGEDVDDDERSVHESMRVPVASGSSDDVADDAPTLTSEAPPSGSDDDIDDIDHIDDAERDIDEE